MAGKIIADTIESAGSQISLNVGNVTVITASSTGANITGVATFSTGTAALPSITTAGDPDTGIYFPSANTIGFTRGGIEVGRFDSNSANANFQFNSGYGSVATAYGCRAWVKFNGTGTVAINASGNVSSITDNGTGDYTVNFTTAMSDANYSAITFNGKGSVSFGIGIPATQDPTTSAYRFLTYSSSFVTIDTPANNVAIFR